MRCSHIIDNARFTQCPNEAIWSAFSGDGMMACWFCDDCAKLSNMTKMKLLGNRAHVQRIKHMQAVTAGGIHLPAISLDDNNTGGPKEYRVLAVGPGRRNREGLTLPVEFSPGDRVICQSYFTGATELKDGTFIITDDMVIAVLPK